MALAVNLRSEKDGEIKNFLEKYYEKEVSLEEDVEQWVYIYNKPLGAIDLICAVMDNNDKYQISMGIQVDKGDVFPITAENHNDIVKGILYLFYKENLEEINISCP